MPTENSKNYFSSDFTLGILGGGQLGKMLLYETRKLDIRTKVMDASDEAPCKIACNVFVKGSLMDFDAVYDFGKDVDVLTIEIENVNLDALEKLEDQGKKVYPPTKALRIIQNKAKQKLFYVDNGIPSADFHRFAFKSEIKDSILITRHYYSQHGTTVRVIDAAKDAHMQKIRIGTDPSSRPDN